MSATRSRRSPTPTTRPSIGDWSCRTSNNATRRAGRQGLSRPTRPLSRSTCEGGKREQGPKPPTPQVSDPRRAARRAPMSRSEIMARIRSKRTGPEEALARALRGLGLRFRRWDRRLPGTPDFVLPGARLILMVNSCFWHFCPRHGTVPKTRRTWWRVKLIGNRRRDRRAAAALRGKGWRVLTWWTHEATDSFLKRLRRSIRAMRRSTPTQATAGQ